MVSKNILFGYPWATKWPKMRKMGGPENTPKKHLQKDTKKCENGSNKRAKICTNLALFSGPETRRLPNGPREPLFRILLIFGVPPGGKMTLKSMKKRPILPPRYAKKGQHSALFFNSFGWANRRHSTKKGRAFSLFFCLPFSVCNAMQYTTMPYNTIQYTPVPNSRAQPNA